MKDLIGLLLAYGVFGVGIVVLFVGLFSGCLWMLYLMESWGLLP